MAMVDLILDFVLVVNYKGRYHTTTTYSSLFSQNAAKGGEGRAREGEIISWPRKALKVNCCFVVFDF